MCESSMWLAGTHKKSTWKICSKFLRLIWGFQNWVLKWLDKNAFSKWNIFYVTSSPGVAKPLPRDQKSHPRHLRYPLIYFENCLSEHEVNFNFWVKNTLIIAWPARVSCELRLGNSWGLLLSSNVWACMLTLFLFAQSCTRLPLPDTFRASYYVIWCWGQINYNYV